MIKINNNYTILKVSHDHVNNWLLFWKLESELRLKSRSTTLKEIINEERTMAKVLEDVRQCREEIARLTARVEVMERRTKEQTEIMQLQSEVNEFQFRPELHLLFGDSSDDDTD